MTFLFSIQNIVIFLTCVVRFLLFRQITNELGTGTICLTLVGLQKLNLRRSNHGVCQLKINGLKGPNDFYLISATILSDFDKI